jgi:hypothetical protein
MVFIFFRFTCFFYIFSKYKKQKEKKKNQVKNIWEKKFNVNKSHQEKLRK